MNERKTTRYRRGSGAVRGSGDDQARRPKDEETPAGADGKDASAEDAEAKAADAAPAGDTAADEKTAAGEKKHKESSAKRSGASDGAKAKTTSTRKRSRKVQDRSRSRAMPKPSAPSAEPAPVETPEKPADVSEPLELAGAPRVPAYGESALAALPHPPTATADDLATTAHPHPHSPGAVPETHPPSAGRRPTRLERRRQTLEGTGPLRQLLLAAGTIAGIVVVAAAAYGAGCSPVVKLAGTTPAVISAKLNGAKRTVDVRVINGDNKMPVPEIYVSIMEKVLNPKKRASSVAEAAGLTEETTVTTDADGRTSIVAANGERIRAWKPAWLEGIVKVGKDTRSVDIEAYNWHYQWPKFGYDDARTNYNPYFSEKPPYKLAWKYDAKTLLEYPVSAYKGRIVATTGRGRIFCLNAQNGRELWRHQVKGLCAAQPALDGRMAYVSAMNNMVYCMRMTDGKIVWRFNAGGPVESSPVLSDKLVYAGSWGRSMFGIDRTTGRKKWQFKTGGAIKGTPALWENSLYFGSYDGSLYCVDKDNGRQIWRAYLGGTIYSSPAVDVSRGRVYVGSTAGYLTCLDAKTGKKLWKYNTDNAQYGVYSSPAIGHGRVYFGSYDGIFYAVRIRDGKLDWKFDAKGAVSGSPAIVGSIIYVSSFAGKTWALNTNSGKVLWEFGDGRYTPATANGRFLFVVGHHHLYAYKGKRVYH